MKLSVVTVTLNCREAFQRTRDSLLAQTVEPEWIVVDGGSMDGTLEDIRSCPRVTKWISEKDKGIYDAMNKGLDMVSGDAVLFLNAGDWIDGDLLPLVNSAPGYLPVRYRVLDIFPTRLRPKNFRRGMPYCHQGIVFARSEHRYSLKYGIAADYRYYLDHGYRELDFLCGFSQGAVVYDNKGLSAKRYRVRDQEILDIIREEFGFVWAAIFRVTSAAKSMVRWLLEIRKRLSKSDG